MDNRNIITIIFVLLFSANIVNVMALGINSQYHNSNPLQMRPGETKNVEFVLVHGIEEKTSVRAIASLVEGSEIAEIISEKEFTLSPGTLVENNKKIILKISIPQKASIGDSYIIKLSVIPIEEREIATVQINRAYLVDFPVIIGEKVSEISQPSKPSKKLLVTTIGIIIIIVIITIFIIFYLLKRKKANLNL